MVGWSVRGVLVRRGLVLYSLLQDHGDADGLREEDVEQGRNLAGMSTEGGDEGSL